MGHFFVFLLLTELKTNILVATTLADLSGSPGVWMLSTAAGAEMFQSWCHYPCPLPKGYMVSHLRFAFLGPTSSAGREMVSSAGVLWESISFLGMVLFGWKNCSGQELYWVSQQDFCPMPGAVTTAEGPDWLLGPPKP